MSDQEQVLRDHPNFQAMPGKIQEWILASPHATDAFAGFFNKGGIIEARPETKLPEYAPEPVPTIRVNDAQWEAAQQKDDATEYLQRHLFGTLAHEIGHDRYNTGNVLFKGSTEEAYVQYRAGLEAQAIFSAFPIFKDLERHPDFKALPYNSIGYLSGPEVAAMYRQWRNGELDDQAVVEHIAARVPDTAYTRGPLPDQNSDGTLTQRDAYLHDFRQSQLRRLQSPNPPGAMDTPGDARAPAAVTPAPEPPRPAQASLGAPAPSAPPVTPDFRNPHHPLHARYQQALAAVDAMEEKHHISYSDNSERLAAAITGATQPIPKFQIGELELIAGTVTVHSRRDNFVEPPLSVRVETSQAVTRSPEQHAAAWQAQAVPGSQPAVAQARLPAYAPDQLAAQDLRHPAHPQHRLYAQAGDALALTYAQIGLTRTPEQLEREALGLALASRQSHLNAIDGVKLLPDAQGQYGRASNL
ncbi:MAG TPA: XVIPCD domain-containing protein, partial [Pseudoxanthomonas sp.]|nr:XVIPCD domain-containing protein [Pseudoxanthomonas sp.]